MNRHPAREGGSCRYSIVAGITGTTGITAARLLTTGEVAELLGCDPGTVRRIAERGELPAIRLTRTSPRRFRARDVLRLVEAGER